MTKNIKLKLVLIGFTAISAVFIALAMLSSGDKKISIFSTSNNSVPYEIFLYDEQSDVKFNTQEGWILYSNSSGDHVATPFFDMEQTFFLKQNISLELQFPPNVPPERRPTVYLQTRDYTAITRPLVANGGAFSENYFTLSDISFLSSQQVRLVMTAGAEPNVVLPNQIVIISCPTLSRATVVLFVKAFLYCLLLSTVIVCIAKFSSANDFNLKDYLQDNPWLFLIFAPLAACFLYSVWFAIPNYGNTDEEFYRTLPEFLLSKNRLYFSYANERLVTILPMAILYKVLPHLDADLVFHSNHLILVAMGSYFFLLQCAGKIKALYIAFAITLFPITVFYSGTPYPPALGNSYMYAAMGAMSLALNCETDLRRRIWVAVTGLFASMLFAANPIWGLFIVWLPGYYLVVQKAKKHPNYTKIMIGDSVAFCIAFLIVQLVLCAVSLYLYGYFFYLTEAMKVVATSSDFANYPARGGYINNPIKAFHGPLHLLPAIALGAGLFYICLDIAKKKPTPPALYILLAGMILWLCVTGYYASMEHGRILKIDVVSFIFPYASLLLGASAAILTGGINPNPQSGDLFKHLGVLFSLILFSLILFSLIIPDSPHFPVFNWVIIYAFVFSFLLHLLAFSMRLNTKKTAFCAIAFIIGSTLYLCWVGPLRDFYLRDSMERYIFAKNTIPLVAQQLTDMAPEDLQYGGIWNNLQGDFNVNRQNMWLTTGDFERLNQHLSAINKGSAKHIRPRFAYRFPFFFPDILPLKPEQYIIIMLDSWPDWQNALIQAQKSLVPYKLSANLYADPIVVPHPVGKYTFIPLRISALHDSEVNALFPDEIRREYAKYELQPVFGGTIPLKKGTGRNLLHSLIPIPTKQRYDLIKARFSPQMLALVFHGGAGLGGAVVEIKDQDGNLIGASNISDNDQSTPLFFNLPSEDISSLSVTLKTQSEAIENMPEALDVWFGSGK